MEELKMLLQLGGPAAILGWGYIIMLKEIKPALDRNTQALGMVAQLIADRAVKSA